MKNIDFLIDNGIDVKQSLELFGDIKTYNDTLGEFLVSSKDKLNKLEEYKNSKYLGNYAIYVHSLKSDAKYFGFKKLEEIANDHEMKSNAGDIYYISEHFDELVKENGRVLGIIREYLNGDGSTENSSNVSLNTFSQEVMSTKGEVYDKKTILVVDDSTIVRNFVKKIFSSEYEVGTAKDGQEALDIIAANRDNENIVAILLDLNMPKVDGFAVLDYMQDNNLLTVIPVSIISGDSSKDTIDKAFTYQIVDMLGKPFNEASVKSVVEKTIYFKELV